MSAAALVTLVTAVTLVALAWRLVRGARARRVATRAARAARGPMLRVVPVAPAPTASARGRGALVLEGLELERVEVDDLPYPLVGLTTRPARGLYGVPCGRHRVRVRGARGEAPRTIDLVMPADGAVVVSRAADGGLVARGAGRVELDAGYIHYPTWARGPLLDRRARPAADVTGLAAQLAEAFTAPGRGACARVAERLVGLPLTEAELESLLRLCDEQIARAPASASAEARARAAVLLPEVDAVLRPV